MANNKMNKQQMVDFINANFKQVTEKSLLDRIAYTAKKWKEDPKQVTTIDLRDLVDEIKKLALKTDGTATPVVANSIKKPLKKTTQEEQPEEKKEEPKEEKKPTGKALSSKKPPKKEESAVEKSGETHFDLAKTFAEKFSTEIGELTKAQDIKTFDDLRKSLSNGEEIYFAVYWSARLLKQFDYTAGVESIKAPKKFDNELDLVSCIFIGEEDTIAVGVSAYTDAVYTFQPKDMVLDEEEGLRFVNHMEFEIYRLAPAE